MKIIRDTREQQGFQFFAQAEIIEQALDAGDYTIEGLEDFIRIRFITLTLYANFRNPSFIPFLKIPEFRRVKESI
jgi:hypothetical protein